jgi:hypothetical protein
MIFDCPCIILTQVVLSLFLYFTCSFPCDTELFFSGRYTIVNVFAVLSFNDMTRVHVKPSSVAYYVAIGATGDDRIRCVSHDVVW